MWQIQPFCFIFSCFCLVFGVDKPRGQTSDFSFQKNVFLIIFKSDELRRFFFLRFFVVSALVFKVTEMADFVSSFSFAHPPQPNETFFSSLLFGLTFLFFKKLSITNDEIARFMLSYLRYDETSLVAQVSRCLRRWVNHRLVWKMLLLRDLGGVQNFPNGKKRKKNRRK